MRKKTAVTPTKCIPVKIAELLGPPPLLSTESEKLYYEMMADCADLIRPRDLITWLLISDLVYHRIEMARYRRIKTALMQPAEQPTPHQGDVELEKSWEDEAMIAMRALEADSPLARNKISNTVWRVTQRDLDEYVGAKLAAQRAEDKQRAEDNTTEADTVRPVENWIRQHEQIDVLLRIAEQRFHATLDEIDRHIHGLGRSLRAELDRVIEGEVSEVGEAEKLASGSRNVARGTEGTMAGSANVGRQLTLPIEQSEQAPARTGRDRRRNRKRRSVGR